MTDLQLLARRYRAAGRKEQEARDLLYGAIRRASDAGLSYREIATATGLSFPRIQQIVGSAVPA